MRGDETLSQRPSNCILEIEIHPQKDVTKHIIYMIYMIYNIFSRLRFILENPPQNTIRWRRAQLTVRWNETVTILKYLHYNERFLLDPFYRRGRVYKRKFCLSVCLCDCVSVRLSVITFSYFEYSIIWWSRPCNPYIFWKLIMLATSTALFWPSTTEYQPVPPSIDPVFNDLMV